MEESQVRNLCQKMIEDSDNVEELKNRVQRFMRQRRTRHDDDDDDSSSDDEDDSGKETMKSKS